VAGNRTFRYFASLPPGHFAITLGDSLHGQFATWTFCHLESGHLHLCTTTFRYLPGSLSIGPY